MLIYLCIPHFNCCFLYAHVYTLSSSITHAFSPTKRNIETLCYIFYVENSHSCDSDVNNSNIASWSQTRERKRKGKIDKERERMIITVDDVKITEYVKENKGGCVR